MSCFVTKKKVSPSARPTKAVRREERAASARGVTKDQPRVDVETCYSYRRAPPSLSRASSSSWLRRDAGGPAGSPLFTHRGVHGWLEVVGVGWKTSARDEHGADASRRPFSPALSAAPSPSSTILSRRSRSHGC
ncbi:hypothetical protein PVAP13_9KG082020 [Panicum virgatum]|uniref:Uncharacterized protein n=1 Tax=Panicum virgatum TaxID=38727 RepID=A0A8T0NES4_PANVG|nr:hypothetical protein PVAP13_9KG082020 [Panicum virgatum]